MHSTNTNRQSTEIQSTEQNGQVVQFPRHPFADWTRYKPVKLDPGDRPTLLTMGWTPLPLSGKACLAVGWNTDKDSGLKTEITETWLEKQLAERPQDTGTGIRCGEVSGIDVDVTDDGLCSDIAHCIEEVFGNGLIARRGSKGFLVPVQTPQPFGKQVLSFTDAKGKSHKIEVLADGQQFGAFGHVPAEEGKHDGFDYAWHDGESPLQVPTFNLPTATADDFTSLFELVTTRLEARGCSIGKPDTFDGSVSGKKGEPIPFDDFMQVSRYQNPAVFYPDWFKVIGAFVESESLLTGTPDDFDMDEHIRRYSRGEIYAGRKDGWHGDTPGTYTDDGVIDVAIGSARKREGRDRNSGYGYLVRQALANGMPVTHANLIDRFDEPDAGAVSDSPMVETKNVAGIESRSKQPRFNLQQVSKDRTETVDYIIDDYIPAGMRGLFYGGEQSLKTTAAVKVGVDIAMPFVPFHGNPKRKGIEYRVNRHGAVVYVAAEDSPGVKARAREAMLDRDPKCDPAKVPFYVLDDSFKITNETDVDDLIAVIESKLAVAGVELALVVLDTTVFVLDGHLSEDKAETVTLAYEGADRIIKHFERRCSVVFVHHTGKDATKGARGSSNWVASSEFRYQFKPKGEAKAIDGNRTVRYPTSAVAWNEKLKNQPLQQPVNYISRRVVFDATRMDGDGNETKVKGSSLLLDVAPYEEAKATVGTLSDIDIVRLIVDREPGDKLIKLATLAFHADTFRLLAGEGESGRRIDAYRKRIKRLLDASRREDGPDNAMKFNKAVAAFLRCNDTGNTTKDGAPIYDYNFVGQGGKLGVWKKYQETKAAQKADADAEAAKLSGIENDEDFGDAT